MDECYFIDKDCRKIYNESIFSHIGLAKDLIDGSEILREEFEKSKIKDPCDFLVRRGYIKVARHGYYKKCVYLSNSISERQMRLIGYFAAEGYEIEDIRTLDKMYNGQGEER